MDMTNSGKASDQILTEDDYRPGQSEGNCPVCATRCLYACDGHMTLCGCLYHRVCALERLRDEVPEAVGFNLWQRKLAQIARIEDHNALLHRILEARAKRKLHDQNKANAESKLGPREFTLTYSPSWFENDEEAQRTLKSAIDKLTRYYRSEIIEFHAVGEFGHDGRSHVHAWYHLAGGRKITDKNFRRAYSRWNPKRKLGKGFEGGHHETIERISDFAGYAEKHLDEAWLKVDITNGLQPSQAHPSEGVLGEEHRQIVGTQGRASNEAGDEDGSQGDREAGDG